MHMEQNPDWVQGYVIPGTRRLLRMIDHRDADGIKSSQYRSAALHAGG